MNSKKRGLQWQMLILPTGATNHVLYSAPCGSTAEYCMAADGYDIVGLAADGTERITIGLGLVAHLFQLHK